MKDKDEEISMKKKIINIEGKKSTITLNNIIIIRY